MTLHAAMPNLNVHYDGMGKVITRFHLENPDYLRDPQALEKAFKWAKCVSSKSDKKKALEADVIVTTSGMLDGGPSIWYLNRLRHEAKNAILFMGYQASGSGGRRLQEEGKLAVEPAAGAAMAAALGPLRERLQGKRTAILICGANIDAETYTTLHERGQPHAAALMAD